MRHFTLLIACCLAFSSLQLYGQGSQVEFGKNRVQYHQDFAEWVQYESQNFLTFWYGEGRNIGQAVVQMAEFDFNYVQDLLEHRMNDKIELIVYTDLTDLKQSNIGSEEAFFNTGGQTKIVGNKVFVYFNGDHTHLRKQIRKGVASVYLNAMLFGSNLQEIVQNAVMLNLPEWFKEGLISYVGENWSTELDDQLRDVILNEEYQSFSEISEDYPELAGHALWYYISQNYGKSTVSNLLYLTRINRSIESGFLYVLGSSYQSTTESWYNYFEQRYLSDADSRSALTDEGLIKVRNKRKLPLSQLKISPDGKRIAYVSNEIGRYRVYIQDLATGKREVILKRGFRNAFQATDYEYPLVAWSPNNQDIAVVYERRDVLKLLMYNTQTEKKLTEDMSTQYQRVHNVDFINPNTMIVSATVRGFSDIFIYQLKTRQTQRITNDFYDDLDVSFVKINNKRGILFASNRQDSLIFRSKLDTILPIDNFDLFYYDLDGNTKALVRVTNTPFVNERQPIAIDSNYFSFVSDAAGIDNRQVAYLKDVFAFNEQVIYLNEGSEIVLHQDSSLSMLDSTLIDSIVIRPVYRPKAFVHTTTNYPRNILTQHSAPRVGKVVEMVAHQGQHQFYLRKLNPDTSVTPVPTRYKTLILKSQANKDKLDNLLEFQAPAGGLLPPQNTPPVTISPEKIPPPTPVSPDTNKVDIDNYLFQSEFNDDEIPAEVVVEEDDGAIKIQPLNPRFSSLLKKPAPAVTPFFSHRIIPYRLRFKADRLTTQLDNGLLFDGLDTYSATKQEYNYPPPGILLKSTFKDLFEDYEIQGGIRLPTTFNGAEYFLIFDDKKKRLDKRYAIYRRSLRFNQEGTPIIPYRIREKIVLTQAQFRYPLDIFRSIRATTTMRFDKLVQLATDVPTLERPTNDQQRIGLKLEYVFDNTLNVDVNIKNGTRYKIFAEVVKRFSFQVADQITLDFNEGFMSVLGLDFRHYQRFAKHSVLAVRLAGATSFGSERILYFLGGVDSWLFPSFNNEIPFPSEDDFAYQTLASNLRGFRQNIRNGNSYALLNTEVRVPIFKYFSKRVRSSFFRNFQLVGFFDIGTAWQGPTPFSTENPLNTITRNNPPTVNIKINYFRDPIVMGYGMGIRSMVFGYFVRLDYAWGIETRVVQEPRLYLSLGMDF